MHKTTQHLISTAEAATRADRHRSTITRWVQSGRLTPVVKTPGGALLFDAADIDRVAQEDAA
jgi:excisionase family DNA binding protein